MSDEDEILAAELAFGLIDGAERTAAEARVESDPAFAEAVARWRAHADALLDGRDEAPPERLWPAILARLPANDSVPAGGPGWWRTAAIAASLVAVAMTVVAIERRPPAPPPLPAAAAPAPAPPLVAILGGTGKGVVAVSFDPVQHRLTLSSDAFDPGAHAAELWVIPADKKPRSLGLIDPAAPISRLAGAEVAAAIAPGVTLAVSIEPRGGSPTGQPTGPVVLTGVVRKS